MKVKKIVLCFENCEVCELIPSMFKYLIIKGIKRDIDINCYQYENGEMHKVKTCEYFSIIINELGLNTILGWDKDTLRKRLNGNDITSIELVYSNNKKEEIYVPWCECDDFTNIYQRNEKAENEVKITIEKTERLEDESKIK